MYIYIVLYIISTFYLTLTFLVAHIGFIYIAKLLNKTLSIVACQKFLSSSSYKAINSHFINNSHTIGWFASPIVPKNVGSAILIVPQCQQLGLLTSFDLEEILELTWCIYVRVHSFDDLCNDSVWH